MDDWSGSTKSFSNLIYGYFARTNELPENYYVFEVNYDGVFNKYPFRYEHGKNLTLKLSNSNRMIFSKMLDMLSYKLECEIWGIFVCSPRCSIEKGLTILEGDGDMNKLYEIAEKYGLINLCIAHLPKNLAEYYFKILTLDAFDEEVKSKLKSHEKRKLDACSMSPCELVEWEQQEAGSPYLRTPPLKLKRKGIEFPYKNLFGDFLHCDIVADELVLDDNWQYEGLVVDDVGGSSKHYDLVHENVVYNGHSLPYMDKERFSNNVVLDDVVTDTLSYTLSLVLKKKYRNKVLMLLMAWMGQNADIKDCVLVKCYVHFNKRMLWKRSLYAGNPNNNNGWIEVDVPLLGELGAEADEPMVGPVVGEIVEPIEEMEEQAIALVIDMKEDTAMLFGNGDFSDDDSEGLEDEEEVWEVNEEWLMAPVTPPPVPAMPPPSTYEVGGPSTAAAEGQSFILPAPGFHVPSSVIEDLCTRMGNLEYGHGQLVKKVIQVSDAEVADGITIGDIGPRVFVVEGQAAVQQRDSQIQQLQTMVSEMSSRESTLMQCILGMDRRLADLERRPPGPQ
ncbi:hypothetical protein Tco_1328214 [Tanacetum coccineum]